MGKLHIWQLKENKSSQQGGIEYTLAGGFPKLNESVLDFIVRSFQKDLNLSVTKKM